MTLDERKAAIAEIECLTTLHSSLVPHGLVAKYFALNEADYLLSLKSCTDAELAQRLAQTKKWMP